jgi:energy-coupling factor transporter transmembrane protein EcfT
MSAGDSVMGRTDPVAMPMGAAREAWAPILLGALAGALVAGRFETVLATALIALAGGFALGAPRPTARALGMLAVTLTSAVLLNLYLVHGRVALPLPRVLGASPSAEGLRYGLLLAGRLLGAAIATHALAALWAAERAADELAGRLGALRWIGVPLDELRAVFSLALRFVPLIGDEAQRIARLQALRAGRPPRGLGERLERVRAALVPALVATLERADQVSLALAARHHRHRPPRVTPWPWPASLAGLLLFAGACLWRG